MSSLIVVYLILLNFYLLLEFRDALTYVLGHMWRSDDNVESVLFIYLYMALGDQTHLPSLFMYQASLHAERAHCPVLFLRQSLSLNLEFIRCPRLAGEQMPLQPSCAARPAFYVGDREMNSGPHAYLANILLMECSSVS